MLKIVFTGQFKKDYKKAIKRGCNPDKLRRVVEILQSEDSLPNEYCDHALVNSKEYKEMRECHIEPDWLLVYKIFKDELILKIIRTGTHSDLF